MKISNVKNAARLAFESDVTLTLVGVSGVAKTSIFKQIYKDLGFDNVLIIRPALFADAADLVGLPDFQVYDVNGNSVKTTKFITPDYLPKEGDKTLIVLDEINRIQKDIANAIFGMIEAESPTVGQYKLPSTCKVVATCNPPTSNYSGVLDFIDQAWVTRLCFVKVLNDYDDFASYGRATKKVSNLSLEFYAKYPQFFTIGEDFEVDMFNMKLDSNNRAKEKADALHRNAKELGIDDNILFEMLRGVGGLEFAQAFINFRNEYTEETNINEILENKNDIINTFDYTKMTELSKLMDELKVATNENKLNKDNYKNLELFLISIPKDLAVSYLQFLCDIKQFKDNLDHYNNVIAPVQNLFEGCSQEMESIIDKVKLDF